MKAKSSSKSQEAVPKTLESFINKIICGDALNTLKKFPNESIDCVVTSPPYFNLRDYDVKGQIGLEPDFNEYLEKLLVVFDEVKRVLKKQGTCWIVIGDTYGGSGVGNNLLRQKKQKSSLSKKPINLSYNQNKYRKSLLQIPSRLSIAMIERGWILRNEIIWHKSNCQPSSATDRFTVDFEKVFFFVRNRTYHFNQQFEPLRNKKRLTRPMFNPTKKQKYRGVDFSAINHETFEKSRRKMLEKGARNKRCIWTIGTNNFAGNHFATFPSRLIETPIKAGCPKDGTVLDPFIGSGTTAVVAQKLGRNFIGIELNREYARLVKSRINKTKRNPNQ